jgi:hypothetical protein
MAGFQFSPPSDLPAVILALQEAQEHICTSPVLARQDQESF